MEGFWEAIEFCEQHYKIMEEMLNTYEEVIHCPNCEFERGMEEYCVNDIFAREDGYCYYAKPKEKQCS